MQLRHQIMLASIAVSMVVAAMVAGPLYYDRAQRLAAAERDSRETAHAMAEHAARSLNPLELLLAEDAEDLTRAIVAGTLTPAGAYRLLTRHRSEMPQLAEIAFIGADGKLYAQSSREHPEPIDVADRAYFIRHRDAARHGLILGEPIVSRLSGQPAFTLSCRLEDAAGRFLGVLVAMLDPDYFALLYDAASQGGGRGLALADLSGHVLAASSHFPALGGGGRTGPSLPPDTPILLSPLGGALPNAGPLQLSFLAPGAEPIHANAVRVADWPMVVIDTLQPSAVLAGWHTLSSITAGATALFLLCVAGLTWFGLRSIRREEHAKRRLARSRDQLALHASELEQTARALVLAKAEAERNRDQAERSAVEAERSRAEAERANRHKSEFLASMSHELRTPLNAINGFSEIIRDQALGTERQATYREYAGHIHDAGQLLLSLINDVLDLAKIEAGRMQLRLEPVDPAATAAATVDLMRAQAGAKAIALALELEPRLGALHADARALRQILINLLSNAVKFTLPGGRVCLKVARAADGIEISVSDTGVGMTAEEMEVAMQEFGQVDGPLNRSQPGTGLGLPLSKRLVELHGGSFRLESAPGQGTTATLWLPQEALRAAA
jgi:signal transduction histidine kinase